MAQDFYDDFAPPTTNFFGGGNTAAQTTGRPTGRGPRTGLTREATDFFKQRSVDRQLDTQERMLRLESLADARKSRELGYETALFSLQQAREKAQRDRESMQLLSGMASEYDSVLSDNELDGRTKMREIGRLGIKYGPVIGINDGARTIHSSAANSVTLDPRESAPRYTLDRYLSAGGSTQYLEQQLGESAYDSDELDPELFAKGIRAGQQVAAAAKRGEEQAELQQRQLSKLLEGVLGTEVVPAELVTKKPASLKGGSIAEVDQILNLTAESEEERANLMRLPLQKKVTEAQRRAVELRGSLLAPTSSPQKSKINDLWSR